MGIDFGTSFWPLNQTDFPGVLALLGLNMGVFLSAVALFYSCFENVLKAP